MAPFPRMVWKTFASSLVDLLKNFQFRPSMCVVLCFVAQGCFTWKKVVPTSHRGRTAAGSEKKKQNKTKKSQKTHTKKKKHTPHLP